MRVVEYINIDQVKMDRHPLNISTLNLIKYLEGGGNVPPIKVATLKQGGFLIRDGRHRLTAYKLLGRKTIEAKFSKKPMKQGATNE